MDTDFSGSGTGHSTRGFKPRRRTMMSVLAVFQVLLILVSALTPLIALAADPSADPSQPPATEQPSASQTPDATPAPTPDPTLAPDPSTAPDPTLAPDPTPDPTTAPDPTPDPTASPFVP